MFYLNSLDSAIKPFFDIKTRINNNQIQKKLMQEQ
jgi:hypothetical protein